MEAAAEGDIHLYQRQEDTGHNETENQALEGRHRVDRVADRGGGHHIGQTQPNMVVHETAPARDLSGTDDIRHNEVAYKLLQEVPREELTGSDVHTYLERLDKENRETSLGLYRGLDTAHSVLEAEVVVMGVLWVVLAADRDNGLRN